MDRVTHVRVNFYSRPCGRGDIQLQQRSLRRVNFYSRPCGRGDEALPTVDYTIRVISTHAPAGGATVLVLMHAFETSEFLLTPLREGRREVRGSLCRETLDFYSRPCGRGDRKPIHILCIFSRNFYSRPCGRGDLEAAFVDNKIIAFLLTPLREGRR